MNERASDESGGKSPNSVTFITTRISPGTLGSICINGVIPG